MPFKNTHTESFFSEGPREYIVCTSHSKIVKIHLRHLGWQSSSFWQLPNHPISLSISRLSSSSRVPPVSFSFLGSSDFFKLLFREETVRLFFSAKGQRANNLGFVGYMFCVIRTQLRPWNLKAAIDSKELDGCGLFQ